MSSQNQPAMPPLSDDVTDLIRQWQHGSGLSIKERKIKHMGLERDPIYDRLMLAGKLGDLDRIDNALKTLLRVWGLVKDVHTAAKAAGEYDESIISLSAADCHMVLDYMPLRARHGNIGLKPEESALYDILRVENLPFKPLPKGVIDTTEKRKAADELDHARAAPAPPKLHRGMTFVGLPVQDNIK